MLSPTLTEEAPPNERSAAEANAGKSSKIASALQSRPRPYAGIYQKYKAQQHKRGEGPVEKSRERIVSLRLDCLDTHIPCRIDSAHEHPA
jgi:hypothetical protein